MRRVSLTLLGVFALSAVAQCSSYRQGIEVDVAYQVAPMVAAVQTDRGYRVRLTRAMITFGEVELLFCDGLSEYAAKLFGASRARAHSETTPTRLGVPIIIDLIEDSSKPRSAGTLKPPPGRYCAVRTSGIPADVDAVGTDERREAMLNTTVLLEGTVEHADGRMVGPLQLVLTERIPSELRLEEPIVLAGPELSVALSVRIDTLRWFDGIDFAAGAKAAVRNEITKNIRASLGASVGI